MSIFDFFEHLFSSMPKPPTQMSVKAGNYINSQQTPAETAAALGAAATANQHYVRLWVTRMLLSQSMDWLTKVYPAVYSVVHLHFGDSDSDLANIAGPKQLGNLKPTDQNHSLLVNEPLTGLLPFRGGTIQLSCGLASLPASNLLESFLATVGEFAGKLAQPQVSAGIGLASSIAMGVQNLLGAGQAKLVLYYDTTFTGLPGQQSLRSGFIFLSDAQSGSIAPDQLWVIDGEPRIGPTAAAAKPITGQNYILLQIEIRPDRDDWRQFKGIETPLQQAINAKMTGKNDDAAKFLLAARLAAWNSPDLTDPDRTRVIAAINTEYDGAPVSFAVGSEPAEVSLEDMMKSAIPVSDAIAQGLPTLAEVLELP